MPSLWPIIEQLTGGVISRPLPSSQVYESPKEDTRGKEGRTRKG